MTTDQQRYSPLLAGDSAEFKANVLLSCDLGMLATAAKYNLDVKAHRAQSNHDLVRLFFELTEIVGVDMFIEAGAKDAGASRQAKKKFKNARAVAFEANPYTYREFRDVNAGSGIEYLHLALTNTPGPVTFNVLRDDQGAPLANGQASILKREKKGDRERGYDEVTVNGVTLDDFFGDDHFETAAMWVDVEGACGMVLTGARTVLERASLLMVEVEEDNFWGEDQWMREDVVSYLYDLGFIPVARDFEYIHQYNIVFVRAEMLVSPTKVRWALARFASQAFAPPVKPAPGPAAKPDAPKPAAPATAARPQWERRARKHVRRARRIARRLLNGEGLRPAAKR